MVVKDDKQTVREFVALYKHKMHIYMYMFKGTYPMQSNWTVSFITSFKNTKQTKRKPPALVRSKQPLTPCQRTELNFWPAGIKPLSYQGRVEAAWFLFICIQQTHSPRLITPDLSFCRPLLVGRPRAILRQIASTQGSFRDALSTF